MTSAKLERQSPETQKPTRDLEEARTSVVQRASGTMRFARTGATTLGERLPETVRATRAGAHQATSALQRLPDSTLRWLAAGSVGLAAGFQLAGAPRLVRVAGAAPALLMGAVIALRPTGPVVPVHEHAEQSAEGMAAMTDEHGESGVSEAQVTIEEGLALLSGDMEAQVHA